MAVQVSAVLQAYRDAAPSPDDLGMFPLPADGHGGGELDPRRHRGRALAVSAKSKKADEAKASSSSSCGQPENDQHAGPRPSPAFPLYSEGEPKVDPVLKPFLPYLTGNKAVPFMDQRWPNAEVQPTHFAVVQELLGGKTTVDGALKKMDEAYRKAT